MAQNPCSTPLWEKSSNVQSSRQPKAARQPGSNTNSSNQATGAFTEALPRQPKAARQPGSNTNSSFQATEVLTEGLRKINIEHSTLKPEAPEFVPKCFQVVVPPQVPIQKAQDRIKKIKNCTEQPGAGYSETSELSNGFYEYEPDESTDMMRLKQIISSLIKYPGQFDDLLMVFMETIYPYFSDIMAMSEISQLLVSEAINSPNFRYNGARLCWYVEQRCPNFRAELHLKCQKEIHENPNQQNVVLFVAELYTQLPHDNLYGSLLMECLNKLLMMGGNDNVKCVCQALKLTGYSLERNQKQALDNLFVQLQAVKSIVSGSALILLNSVINLRESNWGRVSVESSNTSESSEYDQEERYEEMVNGLLYETDGQTLTNEEHEFLMAHATNDEYPSDTEDPDGLCDPEPEMDEEIQAAFEEFVRLSKG